jgi:GNAT superfamily N-acetyltransferase
MADPQQPQSSIDFRDAKATDLPLVVGFVHALADYEKLGHLATGTEADFGKLLFGPKKRCEAMFAERDGQAVGFALWFYGVTTFGGRATLYVEDVFVLPEHRGQGIGRAMFAELARRALVEECLRMEWSVLDWNAPSIAFYRSIGAMPHEGWTIQRLTGEALAALAAGRAPGKE